jgi:hypothetical protein
MMSGLTNAEGLGFPTNLKGFGAGVAEITTHGRVPTGRLECHGGEVVDRPLTSIMSPQPTGFVAPNNLAITSGPSRLPSCRVVADLGNGIVSRVAREAQSCYRHLRADLGALASVLPPLFFSSQFRLEASL